MKVIDITEVKDTGEKDTWVMVVKFDVAARNSVFGPFNSKGEATNWWRREVDEHHMVLDDVIYEFVRVTSP